jgi:hypothetical protein
MEFDAMIRVAIAFVAVGAALGIVTYGATLVPSAKTMPLTTRYAYAFFLTVVVQAFHFVEHIAQMLQRFVFNITPAHGLIGRLDLEQVHIVYNTMYLAMVVYLLVGWLALRRELPRMGGLFVGLLVFAVVAQSYHEVEHAVKLFQFLDTNKQGTPGILGTHFDGVLLHFIFNLTVFLPILVTFFGARLYRLLNLRSIITRRAVRQPA